MQRESEHIHIIRFLKDEKFIEWMLFPTEELKTYWLNYLKENPNELETYILAKQHFCSINISSYKLPQEKKDKAIKELIQSLSLHKSKRKQKINILTSVVAACMAILFISILYSEIENNHIHSSTKSAC